MNIWDLCFVIAEKINDALGSNDNDIVVTADLRPTYDAQAIGGATTIIVTPGEGEINVVARERLQYEDTIHVVFLAKVRRADGSLDDDKVGDLLSLVNFVAQVLCRASFDEYTATGEISRGDDKAYYPDDIDERIFAAVLRVKFQRVASI